MDTHQVGKNLRNQNFAPIGGYLCRRFKGVKVFLSQRMGLRQYIYATYHCEEAMLAPSAGVLLKCRPGLFFEIAQNE